MALESSDIFLVSLVEHVPNLHALGTSGSIAFVEVLVAPGGIHQLGKLLN